MKKSQENLFNQIVSGVLILVVVVMLGWLSVRYNVKQDWTHNKRNTITEPSQQQLASMNGPVRIIAFAYPGSPIRGDVEYFHEQYSRFKKDVELEFIDPSSQPLKVQEYEVSFDGEIVLEYQGRRENLRRLSEQDITAALQRLSYSDEKWIVFLEGHGERAVVEARDQSDYSQLASVLKEKGLKAQPLNLVRSAQVPDNTSVLVIASPTRDLLPGEIERVNQYVANGGNLLWLVDPDYPPGIQKLSETLGIDWQQGYAVFPEYELLGTGHPGVFAALDYPRSPITDRMDQVTLFPLVRSLTAREDSGWQAQPILTSSPAAWLETQNIDESGVSLDPEAGDIPGPLTIGMMLTRQIDDASSPDGTEATVAEEGVEDQHKGKTREQRVVLVGDADFISDSAIGQLGNQQLGLNIIQWLASRDSQISIDVPKAPDTNLFLPSWAKTLLGAGFVVILPLILIGAGVGRWWVRRRR